MKVLVAGASGAIGRHLIPQLVGAGHEVVAMTRHQDRADALSGLGARGVVVDALDREAVRGVVLDTEPEAVIDELTSLPRDYDLLLAVTRGATTGDDGEFALGPLSDGPVKLTARCTSGCSRLLLRWSRDADAGTFSTSQSESRSL